MNKIKSEQLILNLINKQSYSIDEYIILPSTKLLIKQLFLHQKISSPVTILFGPKMSGKTHLAHIWQAKFNAQFLPEKFLRVKNEDIPKLSDFISKNAFIIDDIDKKFICEKTIFHIINLAVQQKQLVLFTSNKSLNNCDIQLPDLLSRLKAAKYLEIPDPDDSLIEIILSKSFSQKQLNVTDNVIEYILPRIDRSIEAVINLVERLDKQALQEKKPITRMMVCKLFENK